MEKLKKIIEHYGRWRPLEEYIQRIDAYKDSDFSISLENSKSMLESIAKEICNERRQVYEDDDSPSKLLKLAFGAIGVQSTTIGPQIAVALSNIGHHMGQLRNEIGAISHGRTMADLQAKQESIDEITSDFLIQSTETTACFLIQYFEWKYPRVSETHTEEERLDYNSCEDFNEFWDDSYGEFLMDELTYTASEILFHVDNQAYKAAYKAFKQEENETNN